VYAYKDPYIIDFAGIDSYEKMQIRIRDALDFPAYYGCNLDALWDCLTDMVGRPIHIEIRHFDSVKNLSAETADALLDIFRELRTYNGGKYAHEIRVELVQGEKREEVL